jgi:predicted nucleic acid-binding protein
MTLLVHTGVRSLAWRRDTPSRTPEAQTLVDALSGSELVVTTGLVLQELLQDFTGAKASAAIVERFSALALIQPARDDYIAAAEVRNRCRRGGVQIETVDALIAQLCIDRELTLLTTDLDFTHAAKHCKLKVWILQIRAKTKS